MRENKIYNIFFPIWVFLFFPPIVFAMLAINFIVDSLVVIACYYVFGLITKNITLKEFYKKSILKVWLFGFAADIAGAVILFIVEFILPNELSYGISFDPFSNIFAVLIIIFAIIVSIIFILLLNYRVTYKKIIEEKSLRLKVALTIAITTMPWTFLLPTKWFYHGM